MRLLLCLALSVATAASAQSWQNDRGPGIAAERRGDALTYSATGFDGVASWIAGSVEVRVGPAWSVQATGPADGFANIRVAREGHTLAIDHRYRNRDRDLNRERLVRFVVTMPRLESVALGGSGRIGVDRIKGEHLEASVGGSGNLALGTVAVGSAKVSIGGSGGVTATGSADRLVVNIGGSGSFEAPALRSRSAEVSTAGSGRVRTAVDGLAQVSTVGSGSVDLGPRARCRTARMGSAQVRCGG